MTFIFNNIKMKNRRKGLRQKMPQPEVMVWSRIRNRQLKGFKFKRQYSVGRYVLDFYCPEAKLAIELDGDSHYYLKARQYDAERDAYLKDYGVRTLRFNNEEINTNLDGVLEKIMDVLPHLTSPNLGEEANG